MKNVFIIIFISITSFGFSQTPLTNAIPEKSYINLKFYKELFGDSLSSQDTLRFVIRASDTLIPFPENYIKKRVSVIYEPKDSIFLEIYKDIVYRKHQNFPIEYQKKVKMHYWKKTINIYFDKSVKPNLKNELTQFAEHLSKNVDSLNVKIVDNIKDSNYLIYSYESVNDVKYEERIKGNTNNYYLSWNKNQQIISCKLQLNERLFEKNEDFVNKAKKLFLGSLGHFSYTKLVTKENVFSSYHYNNQLLTSTDLELLKYHYSYGICKGTDLETFEEQHNRAKKQVSKGVPMYFIHIN